jgi:hypothetical protein
MPGVECDTVAAVFDGTNSFRQSYHITGGTREFEICTCNVSAIVQHQIQKGEVAP